MLEQTVFPPQLAGMSPSWSHNAAASVLHIHIGCLVGFRIQSRESYDLTLCLTYILLIGLSTPGVTEHLSPCVYNSQTGSKVIGVSSGSGQQGIIAAQTVRASN